MSHTEPLLEMDSIHKTFPGVVANDHVDFAVREGEIHGLLGENGAGKSTLMKVLFGLYRPDEGTVYYQGERVDISSPDDAIDIGIGMVHQHFKLIPRMTVTDNVVMGLRESYPAFHADHDRNSAVWEITDREDSADGSTLSRLLRSDPMGRVGRLFSYDRGLQSERVSTIANEYGIDIDPEAKVWDLEVGERQRVEILKALYRDVDLLVLDEPTAVLTPTLVDQLFTTLERLVEKGLTVVIITHKLDEIKRITDRVTVLREGKKIGTVETDTVSEQDLARMMVGRDVLFDVERTESRLGETVLEASGLCTTDDRGVEAVNGVDLDIRRGEVLGLAGVAGNGMQELAECLVGVREPSKGRINVGGTDITDAPAATHIERGISYVPPDRHHEGSAPDLDLVHNSIVKEYRDEEFDRWFGLGLDYERAGEYAEEIFETYDVRAPSVSSEAKNLSGGNLQKLILGRELVRQPKVLVANQPTRGLDVGAIEFVREEILKQRDTGTGVLLLSEELSELVEMSDRIAVMYDGEILYETDAESADVEEIGMYMTGAENGDSDTRARAEDTEQTKAD